MRRTILMLIASGLILAGLTTTAILQNKSKKPLRDDGEAATPVQEGVMTGPGKGTQQAI